MEKAVVSVALGTLKDLLLEEGRILVGSRRLEIWHTELKMPSQHHHTPLKSLQMHGDGASYNSSVDIHSRALKCYPVHQIGHEISDIKSELARVTTNMKDYGLRSIIQGGESSAACSDNQSWTRKTFPNFEIGDCFVGKEVELERLSFLLGDGEEDRVISVWGMGGIGKTTIAKKVYNQMMHTKNFDCFAWVCITQHSAVSDSIRFGGYAQAANLGKE